MNIIENLEYFVNDARNISGLVLSKADCTELLNLVKNGEMIKFDAEMTKLNREIPKAMAMKVINAHLRENKNDIVWECPACHSMFISCDFKLMKINYCHICGQKLLWGNEYE